MMLSFTRVIASASRRAWSVGLRRMKKVSRWAVLGPIPGNLASSSMSAMTGAAVVCMDHAFSGRGRAAVVVRNVQESQDDVAALEPHAWWKLEAAGERRHHLGGGVGDLLEAVVARGQDEVFEHAHVGGIDYLGIQLDGRD